MSDLEISSVFKEQNQKEIFKQPKELFIEKQTDDMLKYTKEAVYTNGSSTEEIKDESYMSKFNSAIGKKDSIQNQEKIKAGVIKKYSGTTRADALDNISDRITAERFSAITDMCNSELRLPHVTKDFTNVLKTILKYTLNNDYETQQKNLSNALKAINNYIAKHASPATDNEYELLERIKSYSFYFETNTCGCLSGYNHAPSEKIKNPNLGVLNTWKDVSNQSLFPHEPSVNDVLQRFTQDCYMLSSLSAIAFKNPQLIKQSMKDNGDGTVTVRFYDTMDKKIVYSNYSFKELIEDHNGSSQDANSQLDIKKTILSKLLSEFSSHKNDDLINSYISKQKSNEQPPMTNTTYTNSSLDDAMDDEFEDLNMDDFQIEELENIENISSKDNYSPNINTLRTLFDANNENWYDEISSKLLSPDSTLYTTFDNIISTILQSNKEESVILDQSVTTLLDGILSSNDSITEIGELVRHTTSIRLENQPAYVTISKDITTFSGGLETNAADSLWVQMIEKAYAIRYGEGKAYKGINLGNSYDFLNRFLNKNYVNSSIIPNEINTLNKDLIINDTIKITSEVMNKIIKDANAASPEHWSTIEKIIDIMKKNQATKDIVNTYSKEIISILEENYPFQHEIFSGKYSKVANNIYDDISLRLTDGEVLTVGVSNADKTRKKELNDSGIRTGHAYGILKCFIKNDIKYVTLRDPYALFKREYEKVTDKYGNVSYKKVDGSKIGLSANDSLGMFNMEFNDFLSTFNEYSGILKHS